MERLVADMEASDELSRQIAELRQEVAELRACVDVIELTIAVLSEDSGPDHASDRMLRLFGAA